MRQTLTRLRYAKAILMAKNYFVVTSDHQFESYQEWREYILGQLDQAAADEGLLQWKK